MILSKATSRRSLKSSESTVPRLDLRPLARTKLSLTLTRQPMARWTDGEDNRLRAWVHANSTFKGVTWKGVERKLGRRTKQACMDHWRIIKERESLQRTS